MHAHDLSTTAGTAFAISYQSDLSKVTMDNLVVFSVLEQYVTDLPNPFYENADKRSTPWKRVATYQVPKDLPACPPGGCYCAWLWVPDGCKFCP